MKNYTFMQKNKDKKTYKVISLFLIIYDRKNIAKIKRILTYQIIIVIQTRNQKL